jgi:hypothetical protein
VGAWTADPTVLRAAPMTGVRGQRALGLPVPGGRVASPCRSARSDPVPELNRRPEDLERSPYDQSATTPAGTAAVRLPQPAIRGGLALLSRGRRKSGERRLPRPRPDIEGGSSMQGQPTLDPGSPALVHCSRCGRAGTASDAALPDGWEGTLSTEGVAEAFCPGCQLGSRWHPMCVSVFDADGQRLGGFSRLPLPRP